MISNFAQRTVPAATIPRMAVVITSSFPLNAFLRPHLEVLARHYRITVFVNSRDMGVAPDVPDGVTLRHVDLRREVAPLADAIQLFALFQIFRRERYDIVFSMNPKSGLLAMLAAWCAQVPVRLHCFTGQVWATRRGLARHIFRWLDRLVATCATEVICDSPSQRAFLVEQGVVVETRIGVLGDGSVAGVDSRRFHPDPEARAQIRGELGFPADAVCILYAGRMHRDKGIGDLIAAFCKLSTEFSGLKLLLVGPDDGGVVETVREHTGVHYVGYSAAIERYMAAADMLCLPSYREGFGLVLVEAGAVGLPVVASRIYGVTDAVVDGATGLLHTPGDVGDLAARLHELIVDPALRARMGAAGRQRALGEFAQDRITAALLAVVDRMCAPLRVGSRQ